MNKLDYYEILGVSKNSDDKEIKRAYKRLAIKYHPDRNPGNSASEDKFKEIKEAYEVLSDPNKRSAYDKYGHSAFDQSSYSYSSDVNSADFGDIFGDVFGDIFGSRKNKRNKSGVDLQYNLEISLEESVIGTKKNIRYLSKCLCSICNGSGSNPNYSFIKCIKCGGSGQIYLRQGFFSIQQTCSKCNGEGKIIRYPCKKCHGSGIFEKYNNIDINIPSGINSGDKMRIKGAGSISNIDSHKGDLYIFINVKKHQIFKREFNNLHCEVPISFSVAALGGKIEVPTLLGKIKLKIPSETQTGKIFRIKGKGIKSSKNNFCGDLFCKVIIETPVRLSSKQKLFLVKLEESLKGKNRNRNSPRYTRFFNGVKKFFENLRY
ncbi:MAG: molecular chaperone DnaJ [Enterobacteriaceae bacterium]